MKKSTIAVLVLFAVFALLALPAAAENSQTDRVILTSGYGESVTTPDKVIRLRSVSRLRQPIRM